MEKKKRRPHEGHTTSDIDSAFSRFKIYPPEISLKGDKKLHSEVTLPNNKLRTKKDLIIRAKLNNPHLSLKYLAEIYSTKPSYARNVWSQYCRKEVTNKGGPLGALGLPFRVHGSGFWNELEPRFYEFCPVMASSNRNGQKVFSSRDFSFVVHKSGKLWVYPGSERWREALRDWLETWMDSGRVGLLLDYLVQVSGRHYAMDASGVPTGFRMRIRGLGTFVVDKTPFQNGTMEAEIDPGFERRLDGIESQLSKVASSMGTFAVGMEQHMALIGELGSLGKELRSVVRELLSLVKALRKAGEGDS